MNLYHFNIITGNITEEFEGWEGSGSFPPDKLGEEWGRWEDLPILGEDDDELEDNPQDSLVRYTSHAHDGDIQKVCLSRDEGLICTSDRNGRTKLWDFETLILVGDWVIIIVVGVLLIAGGVIWYLRKKRGESRTFETGRTQGRVERLAEALGDTDDYD